MKAERLLALTDGVVAVIITIMILELKPPHGAGAGLHAPSAPRLTAGTPIPTPETDIP